MRSAIATIGLVMLVACLPLRVSDTNAQVDVPVARRAWEYKLLNLLKLARAATDQDGMTATLETELNALGADGWEVCESVHNGLILKRQK